MFTCGAPHRHRRVRSSLRGVTGTTSATRPSTAWPSRGEGWTDAGLPTCLQKENFAWITSPQPVLSLEPDPSAPVDSSRRENRACQIRGFPRWQGAACTHAMPLQCCRRESNAAEGRGTCLYSAVGEGGERSEQGNTAERRARERELPLRAGEPSRHGGKHGRTQTAGSCGFVLGIPVDMMATWRREQSQIVASFFPFLFFFFRVCT